MSLLIRINLALGLALLLGIVAVGSASWVLLKNNARQQVLQEAELMMDSALATRAYTSAEVAPLLVSQLQSEFHPQAIPFYAATQHFLKLREEHPEYMYKEATLNPTNPRDRATDWEADLIQQFRNDPKMHEIIGERDSPLGPTLYMARPILAEAQCLVCHSRAASAPASLIARYGSDNGFGWQLHETVGANIVSVSESSATQAARRIFDRLMAWMTVILLLLLVVIDTIVYFLIVRPVHQIAVVADEVSVGNNARNFPRSATSELATLVRSFERMRVSLAKAMQLLEH